MKKLSNVFLLIGEILLIVDMASSLIAAIIFFVCVSPAVINPIREAIISSSESVPASEVDIVIGAYRGLMLVSGASLALSFIPKGFCASFAHKMRNEPSQGNIITTMVLAYLCGTNLILAGGILGLISHLKENRE